MTIMGRDAHAPLCFISEDGLAQVIYQAACDV
jgi:hypothetical protein